MTINRHDGCSVIFEHIENEYHVSVKLQHDGTYVEIKPGMYEITFAVFDKAASLVSRLIKKENITMEARIYQAKEMKKNGEIENTDIAGNSCTI